MFGKVLVANRGEIAVRVIKTCRRLGIRTVAVYSDADAQAAHVKLADEAFRLGEPPVAASYLNQDRLIEAVRQSGAEAVHPGYGLLSENSSFARAVSANGIAFIGPSPRALAAFGDKLEARRLARAAGLAMLGGSGEPVPADDPDRARAEALDVGLPVIVKAVGGGGGIGMQIVRELGALPAALESSANRGRSAFGNPAVYLERFLEAPRHIEVQALLDNDGRGICLGERECSVQRRHQKVIEESPSPASVLAGREGAERRRQLFEGSLRLLKSVDYTGVGTIEFLADAEGRFYFLEVNARIQVEHPATELVTGLDLVEWQLRVAAGEALGSDVLGYAGPRGHAIEARLYAEDPDKNFAPQPGTLVEVSWPEPTGELRVDSAISAGEVVTPFYDPLLGKIVAWGETRQQARDELRRGLESTRVVLQGPKGPRQTNQALLLTLLDSPAFREGVYDTRLISQVMAAGP